MMRAAQCLLLLCAVLPAAEESGIAARVRARIRAGHVGEALMEAEQALGRDPDSDLLRLIHAEALRALARDLQRREGYEAALEFLERHLTHPLLVVAYGETCAWAGQEKRGIEALRGSRVPLPLRIRAELDLLSILGRWEEVALRAKQARWPEWVEWAREQGALRARLEQRARRGTLVAAVAGAAILAAVWFLFRLGAPTATS